MDNIDLTCTSKQKIHSIAFIGEPGIGKTSIVRQITQNKFEKNILPTIGAQMTIQSMNTKIGDVKIRIVDIAGQTSFKAVRKSFMRDAKAAAIVFDLTSMKSFETLTNWIKDFLSANNFAPIPILIVGNKLDLVDEREIKITTVNRFLKELENMTFKPNIIGYIETSAKTGAGLTESINKILKNIIAS